MRLLVPALLATLAVVDSCFSGFRAAAGRDARTAKRSYSLAAMRDGGLAGVAVMLVLTACCAASLALEAARYDDFVRAGQRMLLVLLPYAALVVTALVGYVTARRPSTQTLMSTLVLGPFTLVRPLVVAAAAVAGLTVPDPAVRGCVVASAVLVIVVEPALRRRPPPRVPPTPPAWAI